MLRLLPRLLLPHLRQQHRGQPPVPLLVLLLRLRCRIAQDRARVPPRASKLPIWQRMHRLHVLRPKRMHVLRPKRMHEPRPKRMHEYKSQL